MPRLPASLMLAVEPDGSPSSHASPPSTRPELQLAKERSRYEWLEDLGDSPMKLAASGLELRLVGGVLQQRVLERVGRLGRRSALEEDLGARSARRKAGINILSFFAPGGAGTSLQCLIQDGVHKLFRARIPL